MPCLPVHELPATARTPWLSLRDELRAILGDDLVAMWAHGGAIAIDEPPRTADLDTYAILAHRPTDAAVGRIEAAQEAIASQYGIDWDTWYVLADDARRANPPGHAFRDDRRDTSWALHRAHWLAGRCVSLHGPGPAETVLTPTWAEIAAELSRELEHLERHVVEGDTDPHEATYAVLNGSRILHALDTGSVVTTKRAAGTWAIARLAARWRPVLRAAVRAHAGEATADDVTLLAAEMAPFVAFVRERLPDPDRPAGALPRWSGG